MSKECKVARNTIVITTVLLALTIMMLSSCGSTYSSCAAYSSVEVENEMKWRK